MSDPDQYEIDEQYERVQAYWASPEGLAEQAREARLEQACVQVAPGVMALVDTQAGARTVHDDAQPKADR